MPTISRVALVTGGAKGIGRAVVRCFLDRGYSVALLDVDEDARSDVLAELADRGPLLALAGDVSSEDDVSSAIARVVDELGGLDVVVNNAGIATRIVEPSKSCPSPPGSATSTPTSPAPSW